MISLVISTKEEPPNPLVSPDAGSVLMALSDGVDAPGCDGGRLFFQQRCVHSVTCHAASCRATLFFF